MFFQQETTTTPGDHQATIRRPPPRALQATTTTPEGQQETTKGSTRDHQKITKRPRRRRPPGDPERLARERSRRLLIRQDLYRAGARDPEEHSSKCCRDLTFSTATRGSARRDARPHGFAVNSRTSAKSRHHARVLRKIVRCGNLICILNRTWGAPFRGAPEWPINQHSLYSERKNPIVLPHCFGKYALGNNDCYYCNWSNCCRYDDD